MELSFYRCEECGQIVAIVKKSPSPLFCGCCSSGKPMTELIPNTVDASKEKHVPVCIVSGNTVEVTVGSLPHPMTEEHFIEWIAVQTAAGNQRKALHPGEEPKARFALCEGDEVKAVYAYCSLHGLWKGCGKETAG